MIRVRGLVKRYGAVTAVDDLSFTVGDGELFALLGTNGAGKSTTISCLTTTLTPDAGEIEVNGHRVGRDDHHVRRDIGVVFQQSLLDPVLTVEENLALRATVHGLPRRRTEELVELVDLGDVRRRRYGVLSGGQKRRVDVARALLHRPSVLFLDEPTAGLDPASRDQVWSVIGRLRAEDGLTVVLTTHYMAETEAADQVLVVDRGRAVARGTPLELRARHSRARLSLRSADLRTLAQAVAEVAATTPGVEPDWYEDGGSLHVRVAGSAAALAVLARTSPQLDDFEFVHGSMDDVFLALTSGQTAHETHPREQTA